MSATRHNFNQSGSGKPFLFLHAFPLNAAMWMGVEKFVHKSGYRFLAPDFPGFGNTSGQIDSIAETADEIFSDLDKLSIDRVSSCGLSMGGYVLAEMIAQQPERIDFAVFCDTTPAQDTEEKRQSRLEDIARIENGGAEKLLEGMLSTLVSESTDDVRRERLRSMMREAKPESMSAAISAMASRNDLTDPVNEFEGVVGLIFGEDDPMTTAIPRFQPKHLLEPKIVAKTGHFPVLESNEGFITCLRDLIRSSHS